MIYLNPVISLGNSIAMLNGKRLDIYDIQKLEKKKKSYYLWIKDPRQHFRRWVNKIQNPLIIEFHLFGYNYLRPKVEDKESEQLVVHA